MSPIDLPKIYNPAQQTAQALIDNFVVRTELFKDIFQDIKTSEMRHPEQHYIIQGTRGQGKTTLMLRIAYEIKNDPALCKRLIPIVFNEEQYNISRLFKLWESIAEDLKESGNNLTLYDRMQALAYDDDYERGCFELLENALIADKKKLVVFIDNIDELFEKLSKKEHHRLREVFIESAEIRIVGASSVSLEFHHDYGKPFYQFFKMPYLKGLNSDDTGKLLLGLGEHYKKDRVKEIVKHQPGRIEALRRMTGGVIRTIIILFEIFVDDEKGDAFKDLEKILDSVTPLYKHRMDKLSAQQQEIVDFIALNWDAVSTKEIAQKTKLKSKAVSAQLGNLEKYNIIEKEKTNTKNHLYRIHERFFNIWYLMRNGRKWDERRVRFVVEFLQIWCDETDLESRAHRHLSAMQKEKLADRHALFMTEALLKTSIKPELQSQLIENTREYLEHCGSELCTYLPVREKDALALKILKLENKTNKTADDLNELGLFYITERKDIKKAEEYFLRAVKKDYTLAMNNLGILYHHEYKDFEKAEKYYQQAVNKGYSLAMNNLGVMYQNEFKDSSKAEKYFLMAAENDHLEATNNLGLLYAIEFKNYDMAKNYFEKAAEKGNSQAVYNLAVLYEQEVKDYGKAEKYYQMAIKKDVLSAINNLAVMYQQKCKDFKKAEKYYQMALSKGDVEAMNNLGLLYVKQFSDYAKAKEYFQMSAEKGHSGAMNNLATVYIREYKDFKEAEKYYQMALSKGDVEAMNNLGLLYAKQFSDYAKAKEYFQMGAEKGHSGAMNNMAYLYFMQRRNKVTALGFSRTAYEKENNIINSNTYAETLLWNDKVKEAMEVAGNFLQDEKFLEENQEDVIDFMILLIAKKQNQLALQIFNENPHKFKDRFKPVYYALMFFMKDEYPNEYLKMGGELKETVEEIINKINQWEKEYQ